MKKLVNDTLNIVREAGKLIIDFKNSGGCYMKIKPGDSNFVTAIDIAVQDYISAKLRAILPECRLIMEESTENPEKPEGWCFVLDPVDGTTNLIHDYRCSAISLALLKDNKSYFGIIFNPYLDEMFLGINNEGAFLNNQPIKVSGRTFSNAMIGFGTTPYDRHESYKTFLLLNDVFTRCREIRRSGSAAIDMANVACGRLDGFFEFQLQPWDFAAGKIIINEAGGISSDFAGNPLGLNSSSVLAGNPSVYNELKNTIYRLKTGDKI